MFFFFCLQNDVADKRIALSTILLGLLEQQEKRKTELFDTMRCIEDQRDVNNNFFINKL